MILGAHVSIAGGVENAISNARAVGCESFQIFTKNQNQWREKQFTAEEKERFFSVRISSSFSGIPLAAHASYLVNLCAADAEILSKSRKAFAAEIQRCADLGIEFLVFHPGAHMGQGVEKGISMIIKSINQALDQNQDNQVRLLLETTAGQGSSIGSRFEQLVAILKNINKSHRTGICVDTCHIFAAGYDLQNPEAYRHTIRQLDAVIGLENIWMFHLNDSKREIGSQIDRHERIGKGKIGIQAFSLLVNDERFARVLGILEIPGGESAFQEDLLSLKNMRNNISA